MSTSSYLESSTKNRTQNDAIASLIVSPVDIAAALFFSLVMLFIVGGNILVIAVIIRSRAYRQLAYRLVAMLAVADFWLGLTVILRVVWLLYPKSMSIFIVCQIRFWIVETAQLASLIILLGMYTSLVTFLYVTYAP